MGFLDSLNKLLDENSDGSLEKKLGTALDKIEGTLKTTLDKAESGVEKVDKASQKTIAVTDAVKNATDKLDKKKS